MMKIALIEIKRLFLTSLLFAIFCHLTLFVFICFTLSYQPVSPKPQVTFLGSILNHHDLSFAEPIPKVIPIIKIENSAFSLEPTKGVNKKQPEPLSMTPLFIPKVISKGKILFKPPKEIFISKSPVPKEENKEEPNWGVNTDILQRDPLKLKQND